MHSGQRSMLFPSRFEAFFVAGFECLANASRSITAAVEYLSALDDLFVGHRFAAFMPSLIALCSSSYLSCCAFTVVATA